MARRNDDRRHHRPSKQKERDEESFCHGEPYQPLSSMRTPAACGAAGMTLSPTAHSASASRKTLITISYGAPLSSMRGPAASATDGIAATPVISRSNINARIRSI